MSAKLPQSISRRIDKSLARSSRIHLLPSGIAWIKREDELSSGVSGSKLRKYASLLPFFRENRITQVGLIGGPNSNNLVSGIQLLRENRITPILFIRQAADQSLRGNALLISLLSDPANCVTIQRTDWQDVASIARKHLNPSHSFLVPEGAFCPQSLPGALSLAADLLANESQRDLRFENIYVDSGTGMSALGLILGLALLDPKAKERHVSITLIAGSQEEFASNLNTYSSLLQPHLPDTFSLPSIRFLTPPTAPKYGAVNQTLLAQTRRIAREEGLLMDPTYSVKHYLAMKMDLERQRPDPSSSLFIYNGSSLGLCGFQDRLSHL